VEEAAQLEGSELIGADGLWSKIRETVVGDGRPRVSGHIAYRAVLTREEVPARLWDGGRQHALSPATYQR
jgi:hypothetical protein